MVNPDEARAGDVFGAEKARVGEMLEEECPVRCLPWLDCMWLWRLAFEEFVADD